MRAAHLDLAEHILVAGLATRLIEINHRAADVEKRDHLGHVIGHHQGMNLARRLIHKAARFGDPVVLQVTPFAATA